MIKERTTVAEEKPTIIVVEKRDSWHAFVQDKWEQGPTIEIAVGRLHVSRPDIFGTIKVEERTC